MNRRYISDIRSRLTALQEKRQEAEMLGNSEKTGLIDQEIEALEQQFRSDTGLRGRSRNFDDDSDKARKAVWKVIDEARKKILEAGHTALWRLLVQCIQTGNTCSYTSPLPPIEWEL